MEACLNQNRDDALPNLQLPGRERDPILRTFADLHGRIALIGGSFDPVHEGHIRIAHEAMEKFKLDAVVFIPAAHNPHKASRPMASDQDRLNMLVAAVRGTPEFYVSPIELERGTESYTVDTLRAVRAQMAPDAKLFFLIGGDNLTSFDTWHSSGEIRSLATILVIERRPGTAASTQIRNQLLRGEAPVGLTPEVCNYIQQRGLYFQRSAWLQNETQYP